MSPLVSLLCPVQSSMAGEPSKRGSICLIPCAPRVGWMPGGSFRRSLRLPLVGQLHELALGVHAALGVDAAGVDIAGDARMTLFSSFCQVDELGLAVDVELAIDAFGVVSGGV